MHDFHNHPSVEDKINFLYRKGTKAESPDSPISGGLWICLPAVSIILSAGAEKSMKGWCYCWSVDLAQWKERRGASGLTLGWASTLTLRDHSQRAVSKLSGLLGATLQSELSMGRWGLFHSALNYLLAHLFSLNYQLVGSGTVSQSLLDLPSRQILSAYCLPDNLLAVGHSALYMWWVCRKC